MYGIKAHTASELDREIVIVVPFFIGNELQVATAPPPDEIPKFTPGIGCKLGICIQALVPAFIINTITPFDGAVYEVPSIISYPVRFGAILSHNVYPPHHDTIRIIS